MGLAGCHPGSGRLRRRRQSGLRGLLAGDRLVEYSPVERWTEPRAKLGLDRCLAGGGRLRWRRKIRHHRLCAGSGLLVHLAEHELVVTHPAVGLERSRSGERAVALLVMVINAVACAYPRRLLGFVQCFALPPRSVDIAVSVLDVVCCELITRGLS
ncbi:MAG: hypothetical protein EOL87_17740 [Spartobacteria bacterium]|nr:hypothetical protein [Spartobacteria bacterium]